MKVGGLSLPKTKKTTLRPHLSHAPCIQEQLWLFRAALLNTNTMNVKQETGEIPKLRVWVRFSV